MAQMRRRAPSISVDTKKKEVLGNLKNPANRIGRRAGQWKWTCTIFRNRSWARRCLTACTTLRRMKRGYRWGSVTTRRSSPWRRSGDGGSGWVAKSGRQVQSVARDNRQRGTTVRKGRLWKVELQKLADETGSELLKSATTHRERANGTRSNTRLFCHITRNWAGEPLENVEVVVESIGRTTTETGLEVHAWLDENIYEKGRKE